MTKNEFTKACSAGGYCSKAIAEKYAKSTGKTEFSEKDFEGAFRFAAKMQTEYWEMPHHAIHLLMSEGKTSKSYSFGGSDER